MSFTDKILENPYKLFTKLMSIYLFKQKTYSIYLSNYFK